MTGEAAFVHGSITWEDDLAMITVQLHTSSAGAGPARRRVVDDVDDCSAILDYPNILD